MEQEQQLLLRMRQVQGKQDNLTQSKWTINMTAENQVDIKQTTQSSKVDSSEANIQYQLAEVSWTSKSMQPSWTTQSDKAHKGPKENQAEQITNINLMELLITTQLWLRVW